MFKLIGVVLIIGSCSAIGISMNRTLHRRMVALRSFLVALQLIKAEIVFRALPICDIIAVLRQQCPGVAADFFAEVGAKMQAEGHPWSRAVERQLPMLKESGLQGTHIEHLTNAFYAVGRYDAQIQAQALSAAEEALQKELDCCTAEAAQKGKLYRAVGLTAGIMLTLILI